MVEPYEALMPEYSGEGERVAHGDEFAIQRPLHISSDGAVSPKKRLR